MKYSFIIPVYNGERFIPGIVDALFFQAFEDWEAVFVDDGSSDSSLETLRRVCSSDSRLSVISVPHGGVSSARNTGLDAASGERIIFWDNDDLIDGSLLCLAEEEMHDEDVFIFNFENITGNHAQLARERESFRYRLSEGSLEDFLLEHYSSVAGSVWNRVFRKDIVDTFGLRFTDERLVGNEDILFNLKYLMHCRSIAYSGRVGYHYFLRADSLSHRTFRDTDHLQRFLDCALEFISYGKSRCPSAELLPLVFLYKEIMLGYRSYLGENGDEWIIRYLHRHLDLRLLQRNCSEVSDRIMSIERMNPSARPGIMELFQRIIRGDTVGCEGILDGLLVMSGKRRRDREA